MFYWIVRCCCHMYHLLCGAHAKSKTARFTHTVFRLSPAQKRKKIHISQKSCSIQHSRSTFGTFFETFDSVEFAMVSFGSTLSQTTTYWQTAFSEAACDHLPVQTSNSDLKHLSLKWSSPTQSNQRNRSSPWSRLLNWYQHVHCSPLPQQVIQNPSGVAILIICQLENIPGR